MSLGCARNDVDSEELAARLEADGFDLVAPTTSVSLTINGPAPTVLAFFLNTVIDQQVAAFTTGEVGGEIFDVDLIACPVRGDVLQGHAAVLDDQEGLVAVDGQCRLDDAFRFVCGLGQNQ